MQLKNSEKQLMIDELEQKVGSLENENRNLNASLRKINGEVEGMRERMGES